MKKKYDFSKGERGKFFRPDAELDISINLEPQIAEAVREMFLFGVAAGAPSRSRPRNFPS